MFCINCGKPIDDGKLFCDACAPAENKPETPVQETQPVAETPVTAEETIELGGGEPPKKAPKKIGKAKGIILGTVAAAVVAVGACTAIWWDNVSNFFVKTFSSPEDYMAHVSQNAADEGIGAVGDAYGTILDSLKGNTEKQKYNGVEMDVELQIGDDIMELLSEATGGQVDMDVLKKIVMELDAVVEDQKSQVDFGLTLGSTRIATITAIANMEDMSVLLGSPELSETFMKMDFQAVLDEAGISIGDLEEMMEQSQEMAEQLTKALPEQEVLEELLSKYVALALSKIENVEKTTEKVEVGDLSQSLTVLKVKISAKDVMEIAIAVLEEAENDDELMDMIVGLAEYVNSVNPSQGEWVWDEQKQEYVFEAQEFDAKEFREQLEDSIGEAIDMLKESKSEAPSTSVKLTLYVDGAGEIVGLQAKIPGADTTVGFVTVWQGNKFAFEADLGTAKIDGEGSRSKGLITGKYVLKVEGEKVLTLEVENWDEKKAEEGYICGTLRLVPSDVVMEQITGDMPAWLDADSFALELVFDTAEDYANVSVNVLMNKKLAVGLTLKAKMIADAKVDKPSNVVDATSEDAIMEWANSLDIDKVIENLEKAGFPMDMFGSYETDTVYPMPDYGYGY